MTDHTASSSSIQEVLKFFKGGETLPSPVQSATMATTTTTTTTATVNLIGTSAPLLSSAIPSDCQNAEDPTCVGGVTAVAAHIRHYANNSYPNLVVPRLDRQHEFVNLHPMGWNVNTKVLREHFGWTVYTSNIALLTEGQSNNKPLTTTTPTRDVSGLQTPDMPLLITNQNIPPSNSWYPYVESVHFDPNTNLALISLEDGEDADNTNLGWDQIQSALASLDYVAAQNKRRQCGNVSVTNLISGLIDTEVPCYIPVLMVYKSTSTNDFDSLIEAVVQHDNPPALVIDWEGTQKAYNTPKVTTENNEIWVVSQELTSDRYLQYTITVDLVTQRISDLIVITDNLQEVPDEWKDETYANDIAYLRLLADQAIANDPIVGNSNAMPRADTGQCELEECEIGNLITDSIRWKTNADFAFVMGQGLSGPGWSFGQVHVSHIFQTVTTPTTICTGKLSGRAMIRVMEYSLGAQTSSSSDYSQLPISRSKLPSSNSSDWTDPIDPFLQVSGLQVVYNSLLQNTSKLLSIKVWEQKERAYLNVNPLRLYNFATDANLCDHVTSSSNYPSLLANDEIRPKEGEDDAQVRITSTLLQNAVGDYLKQLDSTYVPTIENRIINDVRSTEAMDVPSKSSAVCPRGYFWRPGEQTCFSCPSSRLYVSLSESQLDFRFQNNTSEPQTGRVVVINRDLHDFVMITKHIPEWFEFIGATSLSTSKPIIWPNVPIKLASGESFALDFAINASKVGVGVTKGTVYFNISDYEVIPDCFSERYALALNTLINVTPPDVVVDLGHHAIVGLVLMGIVLMGCLGLGFWVFVKRTRWGYGSLGDKSIKSIQPLYLGTISLGAFVMGLTIAPLSIDGGPDSWCMISPWLMSLGSTLIFSALLSKLTTAQKIAERPNERTIQVSYKDLLMPFIILFVVNFALLFMMLIDPPIWTRQAFDSEDWKLYGFCDYGGLSSSLLITSCLVHFFTLCYALYQTYRVSRLGNEFHEIRNIGLAAALWFQIAVVAIPTWFTIEKTNFVGRYYFRVGIVCALCVSMLVCIFLPVMANHNKTKVHPQQLNGNQKKNEHDRMEENQSLFGGFLGFNNLAASSAASGKIPEVLDEEEPNEEQNRCLADRLCY